MYYCNVNRDTTVKGLIITGQGKHFSLGLDVDFLGNQTEEYMEDFRAKNAQLYWRLFVFPIPTVAVMNGKLSEPPHEISKNVICATRKSSDQTDQSLCWSLEYFMTVKLLTEQTLEFLSLTRGCTGSSESTFVKMPNCWKSHVAAHLIIFSWSHVRQHSLSQSFYNTSIHKDPAQHH